MAKARRVLLLLVLLPASTLAADPCKRFPSPASTLKQCSTASAFCSSYLKKHSTSVALTSTFTTTVSLAQSYTTVTKSKTETLDSKTTLPPTTITTTFKPTTTVTTKLCPTGSAGPKLRKRNRAAASSCGFASKAPVTDVLGGCSCILATSTTVTTTARTAPKTITITKSVSTTETVKVQRTITRTSTGTPVTICATPTYPSCATVPSAPIRNGNFESGLAPWGTGGNAGPGSYDVSLVSPGAFGQSNTAIRLTQKAYDANPYVATCDLYQNITYCPGQDIVVSFDYQFLPGTSNTSVLSIELLLDGYGNSDVPFSLEGGLRVRDGDLDFLGNRVGYWHTTSYILNTDRGKNFAVGFRLQNNYVRPSVQSEILLDNINFTPITHTSLPPNGDFETGSVWPWTPVSNFSPLTPGDVVRVGLGSPGRGGSSYSVLFATVQNSDAYDADASIQSVFGLIAGQRYQLSFSYLRFANSSGTGWLDIELLPTDLRRFDLYPKDHDVDDWGGQVGVWNTHAVNFTVINDEVPDGNITAFWLQISVDCDYSINPAANALSIAMDDISIQPI